MPLTVGANHFPSSPAPIPFPHSIPVIPSLIPGRMTIPLPHPLLTYSNELIKPFYQRFLKHFPEFQMSNTKPLQTGNKRQQQQQQQNERKSHNGRVCFKLNIK